MEQIKNHFAGTKVFEDVCQLLDNGKATLDFVDLTCKMYLDLKTMLKNEGLKLTSL